MKRKNSKAKIGDLEVEEFWSASSSGSGLPRIGEEKSAHTDVLVAESISLVIEDLLAHHLKGATRHHGPSNRICHWCEGYMDALIDVQNAIRDLAVKRKNSGDLRSPSFIHTTWKFKAMPGKDGGVITRLHDGRIGFFDKYNSLTDKIEPGDLVLGSVAKSRDRYGIVRPHKIVGHFEHLLDDGMPLPQDKKVESSVAEGIRDSHGMKNADYHSQAVHDWNTERKCNNANTKRPDVK